MFSNMLAILLIVNLTSRGNIDLATVAVRVYLVLIVNTYLLAYLFAGYQITHWYSFFVCGRAAALSLEFGDVLLS